VMMVLQQAVRAAAEPGAVSTASSSATGTALPLGLPLTFAALAWGHIRLSLFSTAQPLYTRFPIIFGRCFSKVTIGNSPTLALPFFSNAFAFFHLAAAMDSQHLATVTHATGVVRIVGQCGTLAATMDCAAFSVASCVAFPDSICAWCRVRSHCRLRKRGNDSLSESDVTWMSSGATRQLDRTRGGSHGPCHHFPAGPSDCFIWITPNP
jgi:hypothetical protein